MAEMMADIAEDAEVVSAVACWWFCDAEAVTGDAAAADGSAGSALPSQSL